MANPVKLQVYVVERVEHTHSVISFVFQAKTRLPRIKPGQFLHLAIDHYDPSFNWPDSRVFSIAKFDTNKKTLQITISVKGTFTERMRDELKIGTELWIKLPYGDLTLNDDLNDLVLIAGGTGITPFISFLQQFVKEDTDKNIKLYYGVRTENLIIYQKLIEEADEKLDNFSYQLYVEDLPASDQKIKKGIIDVKQIIKENKTRECNYFIAGPKEMMESIVKLLTANDIKQSRIFLDKWQ